VEYMFPRPASIGFTPGTWIQGILVVTTKIWFNFLPSAAGDFADHAARFAFMKTFHEQIFDDRMKLRQRFVIEGASNLRLPRIGILFQPRMEFGPTPNPLKDFQPPYATENDADIVVDLVFQSGQPPVKRGVVPRGWPPSNKPRLPIGVRTGDVVGLSVLRFALDLPAGPRLPGTLNDSPIVAAELALLGTTVQTMLGGARVVKALPT
jgi:hypothetical protein